MKTELMKQIEILLKMVKPHLVKCELLKGNEIERKCYIPDDDYVVITCENGYKYDINVTCNSDISIVSEVFNKMTHK